MLFYSKILLFSFIFELRLFFWGFMYFLLALDTSNKIFNYFLVITHSFIPPSRLYYSLPYAKCLRDLLSSCVEFLRNNVARSVIWIILSAFTDFDPNNAIEDEYQILNVSTTHWRMFQLFGTWARADRSWCIIDRASRSGGRT